MPECWVQMGHWGFQGIHLEKGWVHLSWDPMKTKVYLIARKRHFFAHLGQGKVPDLLYCVPKWPKVPKGFIPAESMEFQGLSGNPPGKRLGAHELGPYENKGLFQIFPDPGLG